jgi:hypothetical protein
MFRPRPNAAGGSSKDGAGGPQVEASPNPLGADGVAIEPQASLSETGEESFISRMMADKYGPYSGMMPHY